MTSARESLKDRISRIGRPKERVDEITPDNSVRPRRDASVFVVNLDRIRRDEDQIRKYNKSSADPEIQELAENIKEVGLQNPLTVRYIEEDGGYYKLIAGERRFVALHVAGITEASVRLQEVDDSRAQQIQISENIHRKQLDPIEIGVAFQSLIEGGMTVDEVATFVKKTSGYVRQALSVVRGLTPEALSDIDGLSMGHLYEVAQLNPDDQVTAVADIKAHQWTREQTRRNLDARKQAAQVERGSNKGKAKRKKRKPFEEIIKIGDVKITISSRRKSVPDLEIVSVLETVMESMQGRAAA